MTSPDRPNPPSPEPVLPRPTDGEDLADEVRQSDAPDTGLEQRAVDRSAQLAEQVTTAVTSTSGVVRVEPTLKNSIVKLGAAARNIIAGITHTRSDEEPDRYLAADGVVVVVRNDHADVTVDIVIETSAPARSTAHRTHTNIYDTVHRAGLIPGHISITILSIENGQLTIPAA